MNVCKVYFPIIFWLWDDAQSALVHRTDKGKEMWYTQQYIALAMNKKCSLLCWRAFNALYSSIEHWIRLNCMAMDYSITSNIVCSTSFIVLRLFAWETSGRTFLLLTHSPSVHFLRSWSDCPIQIYSYNNADLWVQNRKSKSIYGNHCVRMSNKMLIRFEECSPDKWFIYLQLWALEWICTRVSVEQRLMWRSVLKWRNCWSTMDNSYTQLMQNVTAMSDHCAIIRLDSVWLWHSLMNGRCLANDRLSMHT